MKKKFLTSRKSKGLTKAVTKYASIKEKGLKKGHTQNKYNKEMASATSERQRFAVDSIPQGIQNSIQLVIK